MQISGDTRGIVERLVVAALGAVEPGRAVEEALRVGVGGATLTVGERTFELTNYDRVFVLGAGKAGAAMAAAVERLLGGLPAWRGGLVVVKDMPEAAPGTVELLVASHPLPDKRGVEGARRVAALARAATSHDLVIALISGGGSALLADPAPPLTLADVGAVTDALLRAGATIGELNTVRKHLSALKGGRLAEKVAPATLIALVLSDVIGSPLDVIASGPTTPDPTTYADALRVPAGYGLLESIPEAARAHLEAGAAGKLPETPSPSDPLFERVITCVIGDNRRAARAAVQAAREIGLSAMLLSTYVEGEAREVGRVLGALAKELSAGEGPLPRPACLVLGGETTVTVRGSGRGGRNQEVALGAALALDGWGPGVAVATLATDGGDGTGDSAGAIADGTTVARARALGLDPLTALADNDSYHFWRALGDAIVTGPTGTNVNDLAFVIAL